MFAAIPPFCNSTSDQEWDLFGRTNPNPQYALPVTDIVADPKHPGQGFSNLIKMFVLGQKSYNFVIIEENMTTYTWITRKYL
jgi:hypothetical protein